MIEDFLHFKPVQRTETERKILAMKLDNPFLNAKDVARALGISPPAVSRYWRRLKAEFAARSQQGR